MKTTKVLQIQEIDFELLTETFSAILDDRIAELKRDFTPKEPDEYLTGKEVEKMLKISAVTIWEWGKKGVLKPMKMANRNYYSRIEIEKMLKSNN